MSSLYKIWVLKIVKIWLSYLLKNIKGKRVYPCVPEFILWNVEESFFVSFLSVIMLCSFTWMTAFHLFDDTIAWKGPLTRFLSRVHFDFYRRQYRILIVIRHNLIVMTKLKFTKNIFGAKVRRKQNYGTIKFVQKRQ